MFSPKRPWGYRGGPGPSNLAQSSEATRRRKQEQERQLRDCQSFPVGSAVAIVRQNRIEAFAAKVTYGTVKSHRLVGNDEARRSGTSRWLVEVEVRGVTELVSPFVLRKANLLEVMAWEADTQD